MNRADLAVEDVQERRSSKALKLFCCTLDSKVWESNLERMHFRLAEEGLQIAEVGQRAGAPPGTLRSQTRFLIKNKLEAAGRQDAVW